MLTLYRFLVGSILYLKLVICVQFYSTRCNYCCSCHFKCVRIFDLSCIEL